MKRSGRAAREWAVVVAFALFLAATAYGGTAWAVFCWRNPTANEMAYYRHWWSVMTFRKLPQYQEVSR